MKTFFLVTASIFYGQALFVPSAVRNRVGMVGVLLEFFRVHHVLSLGLPYHCEVWEVL